MWGIYISGGLVKKYGWHGLSCRVKTGITPREIVDNEFWYGFSAVCIPYIL